MGLKLTDKADVISSVPPAPQAYFTDDLIILEMSVETPSFIQAHEPNASGPSWHKVYVC